MIVKSKYFKFQMGFMKNKLIVLFVLLAFVFVGIAATRPSAINNERNLKVLPKDISNADLDSVMETYSKHLNVSCDFCHAESKTNKNDLDYASDDKPEKEITRQMMRMTADINKDYFNYTIIYKAGEKNGCILLYLSRWFSKTGDEA